MTWTLSGALSLDQADRLSDVVADQDDAFQAQFAPVTSYFGTPDTSFQVDVFFAEKPSDADLNVILQEAGLADWHYTLTEVIEKDWVAESQKILHPITAGRFFIHGSHDREKRQTDKENLEIEAGQAFGTGRHETTFLCLECLEGLAPAPAPEPAPARILDLGTGSGVLAMAADKIWPHAAELATDIDPIAIDVTRENMALNGYKERQLGADGQGIALAVADGLTDDLVGKEGPFDLIIANILAAPLIALAPTVTNAASNSARLLLSGLLTTQADDVLKCYADMGFHLVAHHVAGDWSAVTLARSKPAEAPSLVHLPSPLEQADQA